MLSNAELAAMRTIVQGVMVGTVVLQYPARVRDSMGGATTTWTAFGTTPYGLEQATGQEAELAARLSSSQAWVITLPAGTALTFGTVPATAARLLDGTRVFHVISAPGAETFELERRVIAVEVA